MFSMKFVVIADVSNDFVLFHFAKIVADHRY